MLRIKAFVLVALFCSTGLSNEPDWTEGHQVPVEGRPNPYGLSSSDLENANRAGRLHAQIYPVEITGALPPYRAIKNLIEDQDKNIFRHWISQTIRDVSNIRSFDDVERTLGLHPYPLESDEGVYSVPYPDGVRPESRMGMGLIERNGATGFTFSCAACHSSRLFGKTVLGLTNRFPRANEFFVQAKNAVSLIPSGFFAAVSGATKAETDLYRQTRKNIRFVGLKMPVVLGLDTSLAQVALSLDLRKSDPWAEKDPLAALNPRADWLDSHPADSKPAVWWNVKYKNRWLSDGSVVSGNPILTNILWNEIGRGVDLHRLEQWLKENQQTIEEIATAVFSSEAPRFTDFFPAERIDLTRARAGQAVFENNCARCHGHYQKNWDLLPESAPLVEKLKTAKVIYRSRTPVVDVGTDPLRRLGMKSLERLNNLEISQANGILIRAQKGYVPPPLVGIWARWPYFHNNSAPSLCAVLTASEKRPSLYWARPANDPNRDFDITCNGYPTDLPQDLKVQAYRYDTHQPGMGNGGHDQGIFIKDGKEILSAADKTNLVQFLQTL